MKFNLVESIDDRLVESTSLDQELIHILTDLANCKSNPPGLMTKKANEFKEQLIPILTKLNISFKEFIKDWEVHHISGIHPVSNTEIFNDNYYLAFVHKDGHDNIHKRIFDILCRKFDDLRSYLCNHTKIDILVLRIIATALADSRIDLLEKLGFNPKLIDEINSLGKRIASDFINYYSKFNENGVKVILIKDLEK